MTELEVAEPEVGELDLEVGEVEFSILDHAEQLTRSSDVGELEVTALEVAA